MADESSLPSATSPATVVAATSLAPAFLLHPTDEELLSYYLKRNVLSKTASLDGIGVVDTSMSLGTYQVLWVLFFCFFQRICVIWVSL
ncbi:unnamed protein product [Brassica rapa subsp. narinosa]|uniref:(rape) hypothetical protein n=1 Tax=Brassica napus TaxID=3708 RepID=A0A816YID9_BRANA|nr:unnamed protein product [Brassica napus]